MGKRITYEEVKIYIESFGYELLSTKYIKAKEKLRMRCPKGHIIEMTWDSFRSGRRCKWCGYEETKRKQRYSYDYVKEYIESFGYELLSDEYINSQSKLLVRCPKGHEYEVTFHHFKQDERCPCCANNKKYSIDYIREYLLDFGYELLSDEYMNAHSKMIVRCGNNHIWNVSFNKFQQGRRCPICNVSKGEQRIIEWLEENNIKYIYDQPYFDDLLSPLGNPLRPDFILPDYKIWIEYDGEFHFEKYYEEQNFEEMNINDELKNKYAKENGWKLIRIPYWDFDNIEEILNKELKG